MKIFYLPDLGEGLAEAEIREWHVKEGDTVKLDQALVSMETAKAVVDVPAPRTGKIIKLYGQAGNVIATGSPLVEFEEEERALRSDAGTVAGKLEIGDSLLNQITPEITPLHRHTVIKILPAARILASRHKLDLEKIKGTGGGGQITLSDVENAMKKPLLEGMIPLKGPQKVMAQIMSQSHQEVVAVTLVDDVDIHAWQKETDITIRIMRGIMHACKEEPALNAWFEGHHLAKKTFQEVNLGLAIDSKEGLFVPVIKDLEKYSDHDLRKKINELKQQALDRSLPKEVLQGATFTLSNFGVFAGRYANPIIVPPQVGILAIGKLRDEVVFFQNQFEVHRVLPLSLTFDHRAVTGGEAARFLRALIEVLKK